MTVVQHFSVSLPSSNLNIYIFFFSWGGGAQYNDLLGPPIATLFFSFCCNPLYQIDNFDVVCYMCSKYERLWKNLQVNIFWYRMWSRGVTAALSLSPAHVWHWALSNRLPGKEVQSWSPFLVEGLKNHNLISKKLLKTATCFLEKLMCDACGSRYQNGWIFGKLPK